MKIRYNGKKPVTASSKPSRFLTYDDLQLVDDINRWGLECEVRVKTSYNKFHKATRFGRWDYINIKSPLSLLDTFRDGSETAFLLDVVKFYIDRNYIMTNQFNFYPPNHRNEELRQYRWELNGETLKALTTV